MDPLDAFMHKFAGTIFVYLIPAMIVAGLISVYKKDVENWIVRTLHTLLHGAPKAAAASVTQDSLDLDDAPCCPQCRRPMSKRTARKGENRGEKFWGCSSFPTCRGTRKY